MKKIALYLLAAHFLLLLTVPGYLVFSHYRTLKTGEAFDFIVRPFDPYDPFRGRYVALRAEERVTSRDGEYVSLTRNAEGYAAVAGFHKNKPREGAYVRNLDLSRYYMNERMAPEAERLGMSLSERDRMYLRVMVRNGSYVIEGLYLNGIPIEDYLHRQ
jgi:uncharacterized membrane-anchored protein